METFPPFAQAKNTRKYTTETKPEKSIFPMPEKSYNLFDFGGSPVIACIGERGFPYNLL